MKKYICYLFLVVITFSCQSQKSIYSILKNYIQVDTNNELDYLYVNNNSVKYKSAMDIYTHAFRHIILKMFLGRQI